MEWWPQETYYREKVRLESRQNTAEGQQYLLFVADFVQLYPLTLVTLLAFILPFPVLVFQLCSTRKN